MTCPICDGDDAAPPPVPAELAAGHDLRRCADCGFVFLVSEQGALHGRTDSHPGEPTALARRLMARIRFRGLGRWLQGHRREVGGRLLDVGCGLGDLALYLGEQGWEVWGCDPADDAASSCGPLLGERFAAGSLDEAELPAGHFDVVLLNFSLEHMAEPRAAMARVAGLLAPGGAVFIRVPNIEAAIRGSSGAGFQLQLPHHCSFFGPTSLGRLLEIEGFEVLWMGTPLSVLEGVSIACQVMPDLDPEKWIHRPLAPLSLARAFVLAKVAFFSLPWAWARCRLGKGVILCAAARRRAEP